MPKPMQKLVLVGKGDEFIDTKWVTSSDAERYARELAEEKVQELKDALYEPMKWRSELFSNLEKMLEKKSLSLDARFAEKFAANPGVVTKTDVLDTVNRRLAEHEASMHSQAKFSLADTIAVAIRDIRKALPWESAVRRAFRTKQDVTIRISFAAHRILCREYGVANSIHLDRQGDTERLGGLDYRIDNTIAPALFSVEVLS